MTTPVTDTYSQIQNVGRASRRCLSHCRRYARQIVIPIIGNIADKVLGGKTFDRLETWRHMAFMVGHWQLRGYGPWAVEEKASGELVGRVGFLNPEGWPAFELGWTLARKFWGRGYATEAARRALDYGFGAENLDKRTFSDLKNGNFTYWDYSAQYFGAAYIDTLQVGGGRVLDHGGHDQRGWGTAPHVPQIDRGFRASK